MALSWLDDLIQKLQETYGKKKGAEYAQAYAQAFPHSYTDIYSPIVATRDIQQLAALNEDNHIAVDFFINPDKKNYPLNLRLYQWQNPIALSDIMPMLENFGLRVDHEYLFEIKHEKNRLWISDFSVVFTNANVDIVEVKNIFQEAFIHCYLGLAENDGLNRLVLGAALSTRYILIIRGYVRYLKQVGFRFSQAYIEQTLINHAAIVRELVKLFLSLHQPRNNAKPAVHEANILAALDKVNSLDEDKILRRIYELIKFTLRTNYFQKNANNQFKPNLALKLDSRKIPEMPLPTPLYEVFVYATHFEGIHLRNAKVARGGIRWSDRREDFRTEILGLMKAQVVKKCCHCTIRRKRGICFKKFTAQSHT